MGIHIDHARARRILEEAYILAEEDTELPQEWIDLATMLREDKASGTFTPALGTALLARACDDQVDPLGLKETQGERSYSARTLCHNVLVPASVELNFSLRLTGREPINNQPFFRFDHYDEIKRERVRASALPYFDALKRNLERLEGYSAMEARLALGAFLRVCIEIARKSQRAIGSSRLLESSLIDLTDRYVSTGSHIPRKLQACVAAGLDMLHAEVVSRRINDPSRDIPGDVQVKADGNILLSVEVRGKPVSIAELEQFARAVSAAGIPRAALVVSNPRHISLLNSERIPTLEKDLGVSINVHESVHAFLRNVFGWSGLQVAQVISDFPGALHRRIAEIEVKLSEIDRWLDYFSDEVDEAYIDHSENAEDQKLF
ncbi:restriction endonuclease, SacI family [Nonomuraea sp. MCN248]|uniref:Restriction endonuclease, SacI family n=1 Tax=Nonomuraea corallina TaxID=2989783 RepID=A0ABT4S4Y7_9ACTN|nr:restriction endonuclease, SacI family [Nonomuraea corallina]MDA0632264.1 restriction endonuclease, SacI family [Nonomuraea corallina]